MKTKTYPIVTYFLFALLCFTSCQDEITEIDNLNEEEYIVPNSTLANLMRSTSANFGAADDILDGASCFSVELPVTIELNDITIIIEMEAGLMQLEDLLNTIAIEDNDIDFVFPITIIFSDYSDIVIEDEAQLQAFVDQCVANENEGIECADFVYPISFSVFNSNFNLVDTVVIENDEALYVFLDELEADENALVVSLNFPVSIAYNNGETIEVATNEELANAIEAAEQFCDDENNCTEESVASNLIECQWELTTYSSFPEFIGMDLVFYSDGTFAIYQNGGTFNFVSYWSVSTVEGELYLNLETDFEDLGGEWEIVECDDETIQFVKGDQTMILNQDCEDELNCSLTDISNILQECPWAFSDGSGNFENDSMIFNPNGELQISEGMATSAIGGHWNLSVSDEGLLLTFLELTAFQDRLEGDWLIIECDVDRIVLTKGNQTLVLEQDCIDENAVFNCFTDFEIVECQPSNNVPVFNLNTNTIGLVVCTESFIPSFHETLIEAENNVNPIENTEAYATLTAQVYLRIEANNGDFEIFNVFLNTENCNYFECFQSFDAVLETCYSDATVLYEFNLPIAFSNCTPSATVVTYHETQSDADSGINPIVNPSTYNTVELNTTIYTRVEINNQVEIFPIQLNVINCNAGSCTEGDIEGILTECQWHISSYNGSDNLIDYNFDFEQDSGIVLIYTDTITIDAGWSTSQTNDGIVIEFSSIAGPNIQAINGSWLVVECTAEQLVLHNVNDSSNEMVIDRTCE